MRSLLAVLLCLFGGGRASAAEYHVDSRTGDDTHDGSAPARAWRSLARVNATTFAPGDRLWLRAGGVWEGEMLRPLGSGTPEHPIVIDAYGEGPLPAIHGAGRVPCVLRLDNQAGWEINRLELTNRNAGPAQRHRAIEIRARDLGWVRHLHLKNLFIHDVNAVSDYRDDGDVTAKSFGGIALLIEGEITPTAWDDLLVQGCLIRDVGPIGLVSNSSWMRGHRENDPRTWTPSRRVVIRGNTFERIERNGMILRGCVQPLVEHNLWRECGRTGSGNGMFIFHCDDALVQFNEACLTRYNPGDSDAAGFDSDYNSRRTIFQFNYSHDNEYGFILICSQGGRANGFNDGTIVRYNISQNDGGALVRVSGTVTNALIHNNTFYVKADLANPREAAPPRIFFHKAWQGWSEGVAYVNNIICNDSRAAVYELGESRHNRFAGNLFFGVHPPSEPADARKLTTDPRFVAAGGATDRLSAAAAYALQPGSPAIGSGVWLPVTAPHDFAGRPILHRAGGVDRGALVFPLAP